MTHELKPAEFHCSMQNVAGTDNFGPAADLFFFYKNERVTRGKRPLQHVPSVRRPNKNITTLPNFCFEQAMTENSLGKRRL